MEHHKDRRGQGPVVCGIFLILALSAVFLWPQEAKAESRMSYREAIKQLDTTDRGKVHRAIAALKAQKSPRATHALAKRIRNGLPPVLLNEAMEAIIELPRGRGSSVLVELTTHRRPEVRMRAIEGASALRVMGAEKALVAALDDDEPRVRNAAVQGLVLLKARRSIRSLFRAFEREIPDAGEAIGKLARPADINRILGYLDDVPFNRVSPILTELLSRQDIPTHTKTNILSRLERVGTPDVVIFLRGFLSGLPPSERNPVRNAALETLDAIEQGGSSQSEEGDTP